MKGDSTVPVRAWVAEPMSADVRRSVERLSRAPGVVRIAIMPDVHLAERVCVGCVLATDGTVYPQAIGGDIGCGMTSVPLSGDPTATQEALHDLLAAWRAAVPVLRRRTLAESPELEGPLSPDLLSAHSLRAVARREGRIELGTLGRGNHFLELQADGDGGWWLTVHSGSRAMGQAITALHLSHGERVKGGLIALKVTSEARHAYLNDALWAERFARESRRLMLESASRALALRSDLRPDWQREVECSHNHVRPDHWDSAEILIHRKGANSAREGEPGIIPGSMNSPTHHVVGRGCAESLWSSSHGAGRAMSRTDAARRFGAADLATQMGSVVYAAGAGHALSEEAPGAYKNLGSVMRAQSELVKTVRTLRPLLNYKGL